jgi:hypothetical protein
MSFFKKLFGNGEDTPRLQKLDHPRDLKQGDLIKFSFLDQSDLSGKEFEISVVNSYIYDGMYYPEMVLKGRDGKVFYLMVEEEDGEEYLAVSKKIPKGQLSDFISGADMNAITGTGTGTKLAMTNKPEGFEEWLANKYRETDSNVQGAFVKGDARTLENSEINKQEKFSSFTLVDKSDEFAIEIEIYATNETEASVTVYLDINQIAEMWPASPE